MLAIKNNLLKQIRNTWSMIVAKLTAKQRNALPDSKFAIPSERKYPINDASHAANAKARGQQQFDKGNISKSTLSKIDSKANKKLKK